MPYALHGRPVVANRKLGAKPSLAFQKCTVAPSVDTPRRTQFNWNLQAVTQSLPRCSTITAINL